MRIGLAIICITVLSFYVNCDLYQTDPTGSIQGRFSDSGIIQVQQADGTVLSISLDKDDPDDDEFTIDNVGSGVPLVSIIPESGDPITSPVRVKENEETLVNYFGSTQEFDKTMLVQVFNLKNEEKLKNLYWKTILDDGSISNEDSLLITTSDIYEATPFQRTFYARTINVPPADFKDGFPGITNKNEWFGIIYTGVITPPLSGEYVFNVVSDDGFELFITERPATGNSGTSPVFVTTKQ